MSLAEFRLLTIREVAERLRISPSTAYAMAQRGDLPVVRVGPRGGAIRVLEQGLAAYVAERSAPTMSPSSLQARPTRLKHLKR